MTQLLHRATTKQGYQVEMMAGWDNPCKSFFLSIFWKQDLPFRDSLPKDLPSEADEEVLFSNIGEDRSYAEDKISPDRFEKIAREYFGITPPESFWKDVKASKDWENTNRRVRY